MQGIPMSSSDGNCSRNEGEGVTLRQEKRPLGAFMLRRAGMLAVFLLAFCLLGTTDAQAAQEAELFSLTIDQPGEPESGNYPPYKYSFPDEEKYKFNFDGVTYRLKYVYFSTQRVQIETEPEIFPQGGQFANKFNLRLGGWNSGVYTALASVNFGNPDLSPSHPPVSPYSSPVSAYSWNLQPFSHDRLYPPGWDGYQAAVVKITGLEAPNNTLRFAEFPFTDGDYYGRLEMFDAATGDYGQWKWICDDGFGEEEARVACRDMGKRTSGAEVYNIPDYWLDADSWHSSVQLKVSIAITLLAGIPALLDDVDCDGDESKLIDCDHAGRGVSDCTLAEAVGVICE